MHRITIISLVAVVLASAWLGSAPAKLDVSEDKLGFTIDDTPQSLPADQPPVEPAPSSSESGPAVVWQQQWVTEYVQSCNGIVCRPQARRVLRWVAVQAAKPVRTARILYHDGRLRTLELLRPIGAAVTCTRSTMQAVAGEQWLGVDDQVYVRQADGTWKPKRDNARIPEEATISPPAVYVPTPIVTQRVSYTYPVMMTPYRARTPVFSRRCGPVRRLLGWCR